MLLDRAYPDIFSAAEAQVLASLQDKPIGVRPRTRLVRAHEPVSKSLYLISGMVGRYGIDRHGHRQCLGIQIPGDYFDIAAYLLPYLDHHVVTLCGAEIAATDHDKLDGLRDERPDLYSKLWRISLIDASIHRYWIFRMGRLAGKARIANFLTEMFVRLHARGLCGTDRYDLPLSQTELAEATGMTAVHLNRLLGELRLDGLCTIAEGVVTLADLPALARAGHYSPEYLYLAPEITADVRRRLGLRPAAMERAAAGMA